jgi:hypothetical protein
LQRAGDDRPGDPAFGEAIGEFPGSAYISVLIASSFVTHSVNALACIGES